MRRKRPWRPGAFCATAKLSREEYLLDSAHHGLAINPAGSRLCAAGTMSNYAAIVDSTTFKYRLIEDIPKPYWSTNSADGRYCYVSGSGDDALHVISYRTRKRLAKIAVGDHPQRVRNGVARIDIYPGGESDEREEGRRPNAHGRTPPLTSAASAPGPGPPPSQRGTVRCRATPGRPGSTRSRGRTSVSRPRRA